MSQQKGFVHLSFVLILVILIAALIIAFKLQIIKTYPLTESNLVQGLEVKAKEGSDDSGSSGSGSDSSGSDSSGSSSSGDSSDDSGEDEDSSSTSQPTFSPEIRINDQLNKNRVRTEVRFGEEDKIRTRVESDRTRIDVYSGGIKVRYEIKEGRVVVKVENEEGEEVADQELFKVEDRLDKNDIKVATEGGRLLIARNQVGAVSSFPLQLDLNTNQLIVNTPAGSKNVTVLPDQAIQNLIAASIISRLDPSLLRQAAQEGSLTSVSSVITLGEKNGILSYEIAGLKDQKLLGFIPISTPINVFVSAQSGQVVTQEESLLSTLVDILSP